MLSIYKQLFVASSFFFFLFGMQCGMSVLLFSLLECAGKQPLYARSTLSLADWGVGRTVYKQLPDMTREKLIHKLCSVAHG